MKRFSGKVAVVTGAGSGIGLACARRLAREGAAVVAVLQEARQARAVSEFDVEILDIRDETGWRAMLEHVEGRNGGVDILINNAGVHASASAEETGQEDWDRIIGTNLLGTFLGCKSVLPYLRRRGGGVIVNIASYASHRGVKRQVAYATSKGGILSMTLALAADYVAEGVRVNCVCPSATETSIIERFAAAQDDQAAFLRQVAAVSPMGRMARPDEVAAAVAFLASDDAAYLTGVAIPVDGGRSSF